MQLKRGAPSLAAVSVSVLVVTVLVTAGVAIACTAIFFELRSGPTRATVYDDLGRPVDAPLNATRIVVLAPSVMDIVYRLGLADRVVGIGCTTSIEGGIENEYSPNQTALWGLTPSMCITDFPSLDTEAVALLDPGLVLASTITSLEDVGTLTQTYQIPVVILSPSTLEGIVGDVALVAKLFPVASAAATSLEGLLEQTLYNATEFDANLSTNGGSVPSVLLTYGFYGGSYYTYGTGTFGQSIVDLAGGASIAAGVPLEYFGINGSVVLLDQPAVIIYGTSWNDPYLVAGQTPSVWNSTAPYWDELNATKIPVDVTVLTEADPTLVLALPWYLYYLHPTLLPIPGTPLP